MRADASGAPAAGLDLYVVLAELDDANGSPVLPYPRGHEIELEGRGRSWHTLGTASDGTFEVTGLRDDRYVVRARTTQRSGYPILLTSTSVPADGMPLDLALRRPHIVVHVVDAKGAPWTEPLDIEEREWGWSSEAKQDQPDLVVSAARDSAHAFMRYEYLVRGRRLDASTYAFDVTADREYTVALFGMGLGFTSKNVVVPPAAGRVEVVLVAAPVGGFGTLAVKSKQSDGSVPSGRLVIRLEHPDSGFLIKEHEASSSDGGRVTLSVPAGTYKLVVEGAAWHEFMHGTVMSPRRMGRAEMSVVVRADEQTHVEPVLGTGARLQLKLEGAIDDADRGALEKGLTVWNLDEWASLVQLQLLAPGRWPTPVSFLWEMTGSSAAGTHERSEMPFGTDQLSELLPSGNYTLEARTRGGRVVTVPVVLVDGQTTAVTIRFPSAR